MRKYDSFNKGEDTEIRKEIAIVNLHKLIAKITDYRVLNDQLLKYSRLAI